MDLREARQVLGDTPIQGNLDPIALFAPPDEIKSAHRRLLRKYHPDRHANDPEKLEDATRLSQELTRARDLLLMAWQSGSLP